MCRTTLVAMADEPHPPAASDHARRGAARGRDHGDPLRAHRRPARPAHPGRAAGRVHGAQPHRQGGLDLRLGAHAARPPALPGGARDGAHARPRRLRDHHRRRAGDHGGRQPRGARRRRAVRRPRDRPPERAGRERVRRRRARLPLLLRAQGHVRPLRERLRRLPRRLRDDGRAVRGGHAAPDAEDPLLPDRARGQRLLERADRLAARHGAGRGQHLALRRRGAARLRRRPTRWCGSSRTSATAGRARHDGLVRLRVADARPRALVLRAHGRPARADGARSARTSRRDRADRRPRRAARAPPGSTGLFHLALLRPRPPGARPRRRAASCSRASGSPAPPTTSSPRRSTCATPRATGSRSTATGRGRAVGVRARQTASFEDGHRRARRRLVLYELPGGRR